MRMSATRLSRAHLWTFLRNTHCASCTHWSWESKAADEDAHFRFPIVSRNDMAQILWMMEKSENRQSGLGICRENLGLYLSLDRNPVRNLVIRRLRHDTP